MFAHITDFDRQLAAMDRVWRDFGRAFADVDWAFDDRAWRGSPRADLVDEGNKYTLRMETPGLTKDALRVDVHRNALTVAGKRDVTPPDTGYRVHLRERGDWSFSRTFALPERIDPEKVSAQLTNGVLTINLEKAAETKPRAIAVQAG